jgi:hypothetical protein
MLWPIAARADAGVPMLGLVWPAAWALFIPIVLVETFIARRLLALPWAQCAKLTLLANAWSTLVGIPLTWLALFLIEVVGGLSVSLFEVESASAWLFLSPLFAAWLGPGARPWHVYAAAAWLCIPFMGVSMRVERWSAQKMVAPGPAKRWARLANLATYVPIFAALVFMAVVLLAAARLE